MTPADLLREVKGRLLAGPAKKTWKRDYGTRGGPRCVLGHVDELIDEYREATGKRLPNMIGRDQLRAALEIRWHGSVSTFNDFNPTRLWGVLALINKAITQIEGKK